MQWMSFEQGGAPRYGFVAGEHVVDVRAAAARLGEPDFPETLLAFVEAGKGALDRARGLVGRIDDADLVALDAVEWRTPIGRPSKILGVPINNASIARWAHRNFAAPGFFLKPPSALTGHRQPLVLRDEYGLTHPEPELAAVIGRRVRDISEEDALSCVFGFTITNDITSPFLKEQDSIALDMPKLVGPEIGWRKLAGPEDNIIYLTYHTRSKGCDTFAPVGPWLVTPDEVGDPNALAINAWVGDELVTRDSTANLSFSIEHVIATASRFMTLEPGDIIHFGMAAVPALPEKYPTSWDLDLTKLGGPVAVEIANIGRLENPVVRA